MDSRLNREHSSKLYWPTHCNSASTLPKKQPNKNDKSATEANKNTIERRSKSKERERDKSKNKDVSFHQVVNKFKKLFDQKIKFVKIQTGTNTQRLLETKRQKHQDLGIGMFRNKQMGSSTILDKAKKATKQNFTDIISNLEAQLNKKKKIDRQQNKDNEKQFESIEQRINTFSTSPLVYKNQAKHCKSKQKQKVSSSKLHNETSRTISATKKTTRIRPFENTEEEKQGNQRIKPKSKSSRIQSNKAKKVQQVPLNQGIFATNKEQTISKCNQIHRKLKQKVKARTVETERTVQITKKDKKQAKKQKKKNQIKPNEKQIKPKALKVDKKEKQSRLKQKVKRTKSPLIQKRALNQDPGTSKLKRSVYKQLYQVLTVRQHKDDCEQSTPENQLFQNNEHCRVSSSSDRASESDVIQQSISEGSQQAEHHKASQLKNVVSSVIEHDVEHRPFTDKIMMCSSSEGQHQMISGQQDEEQGDMESETHKYFNDCERALSNYFNSFKDYLKFTRKRSLLEQFFALDRLGPASKEVLLEGQAKKYTRMEDALKEEEEKWLNFKTSLQKMRRSDNFSEQLQKIIMEAEYNHLALKSMSVKDQSVASHKSKDKSASFSNEDTKLKVASLLNHQNLLNKQNGEVAQEQSIQMIGMDKWDTTVKAPFRSNSQGNQINININITDAEIKINSPLQKSSNAAIEPKKDDSHQIRIELKRNKQQIIVDEVDSQKLGVRQKVGNQFSNQLQNNQSLTQSQMSLKAFMDKCERHIKQVSEEYQNKAKQEIDARDKLSIKQTEKLQAKAAVIHNQKFSQAVHTKKKLNYEQAPLQIKKILAKPSKVEQPEREADKTKSSKNLQADLELSEFILRQDINDNRLESGDKGIKRIKIFEELKSPNNRWSNILAEAVKKKQQEGSFSQKSQLSDKFIKKNKITISLFGNKEKNESKLYSSEGNLLKQQSSPSDLTASQKQKKSTSNFVLLKPRSNRNKVEDQSRGEKYKINPNQQTDPRIQDNWIAQSDNFDKAKGVQNKKGNQVKTSAVQQQQQFLIYDQKTPCSQHEALPQIKNESKAQSLQSNTISDQKVDLVSEQLSSHLQTQYTQQTFVKSSSPGLNLLNNYQSCEHLVIELVVEQFMQELFKPEVAKDRNSMGSYLLKFFNLSNISIVEGQESEASPEKWLGESPFSKIKQFERGDEMYEDLQIEPAEEVPSNDPIYELVRYGEAAETYVRSDYDYILLLTSELLNYIRMDGQECSEMMRKLSRPLGPSTLKLLKLLRSNDEESEQDGNNQLQNELKQCFEESEDEENKEDCYIIYVDALVKFEVQMPMGQPNPYQQVFNQAVYDQINQILDKLRPFGSKGLPALNFSHSKHSQSYYSRPALPFDEVKQFTLNGMAQQLKVKLGLFSYGADSDYLMIRSFERMMKLFALELEEQWRHLNEGQFEVKYGIMLAMEICIIEEEAKTILSILQAKRS